MTIPINQSQIAHTTAEWQSLNPTLAADVIGIEIMSNGYNRYKRGDGSTAWLSLAYIDKVYDTDKQDKTNTLGTETTLADDDQFPFYDESVSGHRKTLWSNIKAKLKTYFDSIYSAASHVHSYLPLSGGTMSGLIQYGTTAARNVYAKFIADSSGNYYGLHSDYGTFWLHKQNSAGAVLANPFYYDSSGNMGLTAAALLTLTPGAGSYYAAANLVSGYMCFEGNNETYCQLGRSGMRWKTVYAVNGTVQTSDKRRKTDASYDLEKIKQVLSVIKPLSFRYNDIENDKTRFGVYAQDFEDELKNVGLNPSDIAALTVDEIEPDNIITDGKIYGIGYDQFIPVVIGMIQDLQKETSDIKLRLEALERR